MILNEEIFDQFQPGEIIRIVTTKAQNFWEPMKTELTFVAVKGDSGHDWAIYCHRSTEPVPFIMSNGDKVTSVETIRAICPCSPFILKKYRR